MKPRVVAAVDQGTTSSRCLLFNREGETVSTHQLEHRQIYPRPGWVEHDPEEIWSRTAEVIRGAMEKANLSPGAVAAVGVTNQRETTVVWDRKTGRPYGNAIVWQDTRTDGIVLELAREGGIDRLRAKTGLPLATYFSGPKLQWLLDEVTGLRAAAERGDA
ncbi:MAG TPA: FGGY family carbohydrate kinase, partial [Vicinamibacteria bacterium]|nr:FGGY family carbohydrate kinase [Vicinamibacteria bacterium]